MNENFRFSFGLFKRNFRSIDISTECLDFFLDWSLYISDVFVIVYCSISLWFHSICIEFKMYFRFEKYQLGISIFHLTRKCSLYGKIKRLVNSRLQVRLCIKILNKYCYVNVFITIRKHFRFFFCKHPTLYHFDIRNMRKISFVLFSM